MGALVTEDAEKAELLNVFFASVFSAKAGPQESHGLEGREEACRKDDLHLVEEDCVRDHLSNLDTHKSMGPKGMRPRVLKELADVIAEPLSITFERSWRTGEVPKDWRKANRTPIFKKSKKKDPGNCRLVSLTSIRLSSSILIFRLNMRRNFLPLRVTEHWNRLPREVVESPSLEIFKTRLDGVLCGLL